MSKHKLTRVQAAIYHEGLAPGELALVDKHDPDVAALIAGGFLVELEPGAEPEAHDDAAVGTAGAPAAGDAAPATSTESTPAADESDATPPSGAKGSKAGRSAGESS